MNFRLINLHPTIITVFQRLQYWLKISWLPIALIFIFVIQNHLFIAELNIPVRAYFIRRSIVTTSLGVLLFGLAIFFNQRIRYIYLMLVSVLLASIFIIQFLYYSYSGGFLQASAIFYASEGTTVMSTVKVLLTYKLIYFLICPLVVLITWIYNYHHTIIEKILNSKEKIIVGLVILILSTSDYGYLFAREYFEAGNIAHIYQYNKLFDVNALMSKLGVVNYSLGDMLALGLAPDKATAAELEFVANYKIQHPTSTSISNFGLLKNRNLIFIQVESLENAVINQKIAGQEITPNLNKLAIEGLYFSNYYAPIGPGNTADAEFMTLNSLYSLPDTVAFIQYAQNRYTALPGLLQKNGYHTYSLHGDVTSFWNRANIYPKLGYGKMIFQPDFVISRNIGVYHLGDKDFFEQSIPKLKSMPQPFMATLITLTSHTPFEMPADLKYLNIPSTTTLNSFQQNYLQSIRYTDQAIGNFIEQLKLAGLYDNSLILIYGDHDSFTKISNALGVKNSIFESMQSTQVPMIVLAPGTKLKGKREVQASHLDVYPTVANLLGVELPLNVFGRDMIEGKNTVAINRRLISGAITSIITNKLAFQSASDGVFEHGTCLNTVNKKRLAVDDCKSLFLEESSAVRASDLMVKENLIDKQ